MTKNYRQLTASIQGRLNPDNLYIIKEAQDSLAMTALERSTISYSDVLTYIKYAMEGVAPEYTQKSKEAGERVKEHLTNGLERVTFKYQGSVMTNTHIKGYSDIDLLAISEKFYYYDANSIRQILDNPSKRAEYYASSITKLENVGIPSYPGAPLEDLRKLRADSEIILSGKYSICDFGKNKAIRIKNLNINREVDIVIACWFDSVHSIINGAEDYRGIQIYNKYTHSREDADFPFLSIQRINDRSSETNGRLKKMIRFLKNNKIDSGHEIDLSSFDINAICYDIEVSKYKELSFSELVPVIYNQLKSICNNQIHSDNLTSVDGREYIFRGQINKLENLKKLLAEVDGICLDLKRAMYK